MGLWYALASILGVEGQDVPADGAEAGSALHCSVAGRKPRPPMASQTQSSFTRLQAAIAPEMEPHSRLDEVHVRVCQAYPGMVTAGGQSTAAEVRTAHPRS